jgi:putative PIG3 family NAD(P)H quinone oxidoreductase
MWAVTLPSFGGPEVLTWAQVADPVPRAGEVIVEVRAAGLNRADLMQRRGRYAPPAGASDLPGLECSGVIADIGPDVEGWRPGDEVCALLAGGGYAQRVAVPKGQLLPVPTGVTLVEAAALPEAACTVWSMVFGPPHMTPLHVGQTLLIHGGTSGIGTFALQLARALGIHVVTTSGTPQKCAKARELGAELAIDYAAEDFVERIRDYTNGRGVDAILDVVGGPYLARNIDALAPDGRLSLVSMQRGSRAELDIAALMPKRVTIYAGTLRARPPEQKAAIVAAVREHVWPLVAAGAVRPVIHARVPMSNAPKAHRIMESGEHIGKILLTNES